MSLEPGTYKIKNVRSGTFLDLWGGSPDEGTPIQGYEEQSGDNQKWILKWTGVGNQVTLQNLQSGSYLGAAGSIENGVKAVGNYNAIPLYIIAAEKGYAIEAANDRGYALDLYGGEKANVTPVIFYTSQANNNQKWYFEKAA
ncbi:unnamed protein product [Rhizoctonia solani]|uniref:Ricin B lectin domain-containing protein n=1 Tax=Rhizoctonia solani TaxID=456999 RepID=A0A8H3D277_9AGAM|nr:unnamed protein product [Rhizoctonia solani]